jgi:hypothetical protein
MVTQRRLAIEGEIYISVIEKGINRHRHHREKGFNINKHHRRGFNTSYTYVSPGNMYRTMEAVSTSMSASRVVEW